jgi:hypothetical protein
MSQNTLQIPSEQDAIYRKTAFNAALSLLVLGLPHAANCLSIGQYNAADRALHADCTNNSRSQPIPAPLSVTVRLTLIISKSVSVLLSFQKQALFKQQAYNNSCKLLLTSG